MFRRFTSVLNSAVEALAPNQPLQDDFVFHWKAVTNFFMENRDAKSPVEETNIPMHLQNMLDILINEEQQDDSGSTGPCMEYLLHHKLLETLYTIGRADCPPGMKQKTLTFYTKLLSKIKQPLLPHVNVFRSVHKLIRVCGEVKASPTEVEEMQFLCTVCDKLKEHPHVVNFFLEEAKSAQKGDSDKLEFGLVDALLGMSHSADSRVAMKCCEGLILITSLPEVASAHAINHHTKFIHEITNWLNTAYTNLPRNVDPANVESVEARWGIDHVTSRETAFPGHRHVVNFISLFDYCNILIKEANPVISTVLVTALRKNFLEPAMKPDLLKEEDDHFMSATAYLTKSLQFITSESFNDEICDFIFEKDVPPSQRTLSQVLIERCDDPSEVVSTLNLRLFEAILQKPNELAAMELVGRYLVQQGYYDESKSPDYPVSQPPTPTSSASSSTPATTSGIETSPLTVDDEASFSSMFNTDYEESSESVPVNNIVSHYLSLVPESLQSSHQIADTDYNIYLNDAHRQFADINLLCSEWSWNVESDDESCGKEFFEGPFLRILFGRIAQMTEQSYGTNLLLTSIVSRLALLPHPFIHQYLLNPFIPMKDGVTNLSTAFNELLNLVTVHAKNCKNITAKLTKKRNRLMGIFGGDFSDITADEDRFLGAIIVLEEFCKELAAISFAKHHIMFY